MNLYKLAKVYGFSEIAKGYFESFWILFGAWIVAVFPARFWEKGLNNCKELEAIGASPCLKKSST